MKKTICLILVLITAITSLSACNISSKISGALEENAESRTMIEEMLTALSEGRTSDAAALMHPDKVENSNAAIAQMIDFLGGRSVSSLELVNINFSSSVGTSGKIKEEDISYKAILNDGTVIYLNAFYVSNKAGAGFSAFQLVIGVV